MLCALCFVIYSFTLLEPIMALYGAHKWSGAWIDRVLLGADVNDYGTPGDIKYHQFCEAQTQYDRNIPQLYLQKEYFDVAFTNWLDKKMINGFILGVDNPMVNNSPIMHSDTFVECNNLIPNSKCM